MKYLTVRQKPSSEYPPSVRRQWICGFHSRGAAKGVKNTDKTGDEVFGFIQGEKEFFNNIRNRFKKTVQQVAVFQEEMS